MTARRRFVALSLLLPAVLLCAGCAALHPRLTLIYERSEAETTGGPARLRTHGNKAGASFSIDLP